MTTRALCLTLIIAALVIAGAYFAAPQPPSELERPITISGNYSDDWMKMCGPIEGPAQKSCTTSLDAAYGLATGRPVPADTKEDGPGARLRIGQ